MFGNNVNMIAPVAYPITDNLQLVCFIISIIVSSIVCIYLMIDEEFLLGLSVFSISLILSVIFLIPNSKIVPNYSDEYQDVYMRVNNNSDYTRALQAYVTEDCQMNEDNYHNFINLITSNNADQYIKSLNLPKSSNEVIKMCRKTVFKKESN